MRSERRAKLYAGIGFLISAMTASAGIGDLCMSAPKCWQYHRDVCYGYYPTKWRSWESTCGTPISAGAEVRIIHESGQPIRNGSEVLRAPNISAPPANVKPAPRAESAGSATTQFQPPAAATTVYKAFRMNEPAGTPVAARR